jgi:hypothetical protein
MLITKLIKEDYGLTNSVGNKPDMLLAKVLLFYCINLSLFTPLICGDADDNLESEGV